MHYKENFTRCRKAIFPDCLWNSHEVHLTLYLKIHQKSGGPHVSEILLYRQYHRRKRTHRERVEEARSDPEREGCRLRSSPDREGRGCQALRRCADRGQDRRDQPRRCRRRRNHQRSPERDPRFLEGPLRGHSLRLGQRFRPRPYYLRKARKGPHAHSGEHRGSNRRPRRRLRSGK